MARQDTSAMQAHADVLIARSHKWAEGIRHRDGLKTYQFTSSRQNPDGSYAMYMASELGCTCPGHRNRGRCAHVLAIKTVAEQARERAAVKPRTTLEALMDEWADSRTVSAF